MRTTAALAALVLLLDPAACSRAKNAALVAEAGACRITQRDLAYRQAVLKITEEGRVVEPGIVLSHLIKPCIGAEIMKKYGQPVTGAELEGEAKRIDESTLMPEVLNRIKAVFGDDRKAYLQDYVMPVYVSRVLPYDIVRSNAEIQAYKRAEAQGWLDQVRSHPDRFLALGKQKTGQEPGWVRVSVTGGWEMVDPKDPRRMRAPGGLPQGASPETAAALSRQRQSQSEESVKWVKGLIEAHLKNTRPGDILSDVIEFPESFLVARYEKRDGDAYLLRIAGFQKRDYDDFFFEASKAFPVRVFDKAVLSEMTRLVPWTQKFAFTQG